MTGQRNRGEAVEETFRKSEEERVSERKSEAPKRRHLKGGRWRVLRIERVKALTDLDKSPVGRGVRELDFWGSQSLLQEAVRGWESRVIDKVRNTHLREFEKLFLWERSALYVEENRLAKRKGS